MSATKSQNNIFLAYLVCIITKVNKKERKGFETLFLTIPSQQNYFRAVSSDLAAFRISWAKTTKRTLYVGKEF